MHRPTFRVQIIGRSGSIKTEVTHIFLVITVLPEVPGNLYYVFIVYFEYFCIKMYLSFNTTVPKACLLSSGIETTSKHKKIFFQSLFESKWQNVPCTIEVLAHHAWLLTPQPKEDVRAKENSKFFINFDVKHLNQIFANKTSVKQNRNMSKPRWMCSKNTGKVLWWKGKICYIVHDSTKYKNHMIIILSTEKILIWKQKYFNNQAYICFSINDASTNDLKFFYSI